MRSSPRTTTACATELERLGGTVEKFIGDAVVGVFGAPVAHEDDPERAVRAALAIQEAIAELNEADPQLELEVRIGVNTGEALVTVGARPELGRSDGRRRRHEYGGAPAVGCAAGRDPRRRDDLPRDRSRDRVPRATPSRRRARQGRSGLAAVARARGSASTSAERAGAARRPRARARRARGALERARAAREPQLVTLVGVPGIGKSRLVYELFRTVEDDQELIPWRQGRSLPYGEGVAFWALGEIVKATGRHPRDRRRATRAQKLDSAVRDLVDVEARRLGRAPSPPARRTRRRRRRLRARARRTRCCLAPLPRGARRQPSDGARVRGSALGRRRAPRLRRRARRLGRPTFRSSSSRPRGPSCSSGARAGGRQAERRDALARAAHRRRHRRLVDALLERSLLPAETQSELLAHAGGNPLYAEEFARMHAAGATAPALPESLQAIVAARLDALPADEKSLLQDAAVLGKVFWTGRSRRSTVRSGRAAREPLRSLERKEFVRASGAPRWRSEQQYAFLHALVRDVAYGQIPRAERAEKHRAPPSGSRRSGRPEDHADLLAHHYGAALELAEPQASTAASTAARSRSSTQVDRAAPARCVLRGDRAYSAALELWPRDASARTGCSVSVAHARSGNGPARRSWSKRATLLGERHRRSGRGRARAQPPLLGSWRDGRVGRANRACGRPPRRRSALPRAGGGPPRSSATAHAERRVRRAIEVGERALAVARRWRRRRARRRDAEHRRIADSDDRLGGRPGAHWRRQWRSGVKSVVAANSRPRHVSRRPFERGTSHVRPSSVSRASRRPAGRSPGADPLAPRRVRRRPLPRGSMGGGARDHRRFLAEKARWLFFLDGASASRSDALARGEHAPADDADDRSSSRATRSTRSCCIRRSPCCDRRPRPRQRAAGRRARGRAARPVAARPGQEPRALWVVDLSYVLRALGRGAEFVDALGPAAWYSPWVDGALALAEASRGRRGRDLHQMGTRPFAALRPPGSGSSGEAIGRRISMQRRRSGAPWARPPTSTTRKPSAPRRAGLSYRSV